MTEGEARAGGPACFGAGPADPRELGCWPRASLAEICSWLRDQRTQDWKAGMSLASSSSGGNVHVECEVQRGAGLDREGTSRPRPVGSLPPFMIRTCISTLDEMPWGSTSCGYYRDNVALVVPGPCFQPFPGQAPTEQDLSVSLLCWWRPPALVSCASFSAWMESSSPGSLL